MSKIVSLAVACLFLLVGLCGCNLNNSVGELPQPQVLYSADVLKISMKNVTALDPAYVSTSEEIMLCRLIFSGLLKSGSQGLEPDLAERWEISADGKRITFFLNPEAKFHNGNPVTAADVRFSWERALRIGAPSSYLFKNIVGALEVASGETRTLSGVEVYDDRLVVNLIQPQESFLSWLAAPGAFVLQRNELVEQGNNFARPSELFKSYALPSGSGPLRLSEWIDGRSIALTVFSGYHGEAFPYRRCEVSLKLLTEDAVLKMEAADMDIVYRVSASELPLGRQYSELQLINEPQRSFTYVVLNPNWSYVIDDTNSKNQPIQVFPFAEAGVRCAVLGMIYTAEMLAVASDGLGRLINNITEEWYNVKSQTLADYLNGQDNPLHTNERVSQSAALSLLAEFDYPNGMALPVLPLFCDSSAESFLLAQKMQEVLLEIGIETQLNQLSSADFLRAQASGTAAIYVGCFSDLGGGLELFFARVLDDRNQLAVPAGDWSSRLYEAYNYAEPNRANELAVVEQQLLEAGIFKCIYVKQSSLAYSRYKEEMQSLIYKYILPFQDENR